MQKLRPGLSFKSFFNERICNLPNANYCGIFNSNEQNVYDKLSQYDILFFPTRWKIEGVPGILVEAKIAGVPVIASDVSFNSLIVEDKIDGILVSSDSLPDLQKATIFLANNHDVLKRMSEGALTNSKKYLIDTYLDGIIDQFKDF